MNLYFIIYTKKSEKMYRIFRKKKKKKYSRTKVFSKNIGFMWKKL